MSEPFEGEFVGRPTKAEFGPDAKSDKVKCRVTMEITEGPRAGVQVPYEGDFSKDYIGRTKRNLMAIGWQGKTSATIVSDITAFAESKTAEGRPRTVAFSTRIAEAKYEDTGKVRRWTAVRSIGYSAPPLKAADASHIKDVDSWFAELNDSTEGQPPQTQQPRNNANPTHPNAPGNNRGGAPF